MPTLSPNSCAEGLNALERTTFLVEAMLARLAEIPPVVGSILQGSFQELQTQYLEQTSALSRVFESLETEEAQPVSEAADDEGEAG